MNADSGRPTNQELTISEAEKHKTLKKVVFSSFLGNFIEWFDYASYSYLATVLALVFFPGEDKMVATMMTFGVFAAALAGAAFSGHEVEFVVSLGSTGVMAAVLYFVVGFGKITMMTLNAYSSYMSSATLVSGFRGMRTVSLVHRFIYVLGMVTLAVLIALAGSHSFIHSFYCNVLIYPVECISACSKIRTRKSFEA